MGGTAMQIITVLILLFALAISVFAVQNSAPVDIQLLFWSYSDISLVVIILGTFITGVVLTILLNMAKNFKQMLQINDLKNKNRQLVGENQRQLDEINKLKAGLHPPENS